MAKDCPLPDCDGALYYDTCDTCGHRVEPDTSQRTNIHRPSDEDYRQQIRKLQR